MFGNPDVVTFNYASIKKESLNKAFFCLRNSYAVFACNYATQKQVLILYAKV